MLEHWQEIQQKIQHFEAFKVMTDFIKDIQKMQEKSEKEFDKCAKKQAQKTF